MKPYLPPTLEATSFQCSSLIAESMHEEPGKWSPGPDDVRENIEELTLF